MRPRSPSPTSSPFVLNRFRLRPLLFRQTAKRSSPTFQHYLVVRGRHYFSCSFPAKFMGGSRLSWKSTMFRCVLDSDHGTQCAIPDIDVCIRPPRSTAMKTILLLLVSIPVWAMTIQVGPPFDFFSVSIGPNVRLDPLANGPQPDGSIPTLLWDAPFGSAVFGSLFDL